MNSKRCREAIAHATNTAKNETCTLQSLEEVLLQVSDVLEQDRISALAFIASTAAESCKSAVVDSELAKKAVVDICERLLVALDNSRPFDFSQADFGLMALLFPQQEEQLEVRSKDVDDAKAAKRDSEKKPQTHEADGTETTEELCPCTDEQLLAEFLREAEEHVRSAEQLMLELENDPSDQEVINGLFRIVHSLKGSAGVVELKSLGEVSHLAESLLAQSRDGKLSLRGNVFEVILSAFDKLEEQIALLSECHVQKLPLRCPLAPRILLECLVAIKDSGYCSNELLRQLKSLSAKTIKPEAAKPKSATRSDTLRVDGKRLEQLIDLIGELVITDAMAQQELNRRAGVNASSVSLRLRKVVREIQQLSLTLKMVPIGNVFQKLNRLVRDLSLKLNKQVEVQIVGAETEVDKTLLECIADPLVHLIRNSMDHGIEQTANERLAAGKPAVATIRLKAEHCSGSVHLHVSDDGRGLDHERIVTRALERGLIDPSADLSEAEIYNLIFEPGFSTATEVTEISGRGVGMDVVRKNVESMRGNISITSKPGLGTEVCLELPLTLSIIDGTVVRIGERSFIVPTLSVVEQVQFASVELSGSTDHRLVRFRSKFIPLQQLGDILGAPHAQRLKHGHVVMIVECGRRQHALVVDEVLGQQPVVIKPLGTIMAGVKYFAGGALLSDGQIGFVLDLNAVCGVHS